MSKQKDVAVTRVPPNQPGRSPVRGKVTDLTDQIPLRDMEQFGVLLDKRRGLTHAAICKKWRLSLGQVKHIIYHKRIEDFAISSEEIKKFVLNINARMALLQNEVLESITRDDIKKAPFTQRLIGLGILADKTKQYDAHYEGSDDHLPRQVEWRDRDELIRRIRQKQRESPTIRALNEEDAVILDDSETGAGAANGGQNTGEFEQGDLFPPESVEEHSSPKRKPPVTTEGGNSRLGLRFVTDKRRT